jgi:DNA-binding NarL/FixJ family response regulator
MAIRVLLAEDHQIVRQGLKAVLEREGYQVIGEAADGHQALEMAQALHPDVAVLDFDMPLLNGIDAAREITRTAPGTRSLLLTMYTEDQYVLRAIQAGVRGVVAKTQAAPDLLQAIQEVHRGEVYLSPRISRAVVDAYLGKSPLPSDPLTARERQVLQLVAEGKSTKEIAKLLSISYKTAECHRTRIMDKLDLHDTANLVRYAIRQGLVKP